MSRLPRYTRLSRGGAIKRKKRKPSEFARIYGSKARVRWVKSCRCVAQLGGGCGGMMENAHTENGGMGRKANAETIVPMCQMHHAELHIRGMQTFEFQYGLDLKQLAMCTDMLWQLARYAA